VCGRPTATAFTACCSFILLFSQRLRAPFVHYTSQIDEMEPQCSMMEGPDSSSLAFALSGVTVTLSASTEPFGRQFESHFGSGSRKSVCPGASPLVNSACETIGLIMKQLSVPRYRPAEVLQSTERGQGLCFALRSALGAGGRLLPVDEETLFELSSKLSVRQK
jgi:hypothetical protein